jgi:hypothetical protein
MIAQTRRKPNDEWQLQVRNTQLEGLSTANDNQIARLSAVIND